MLSTIHNDHANMNLLLTLLRKKIQLLEKDEKIDYRLIKTVISYLRNYSDKYHHPMEDLIYDYYLKYRDAPKELSIRLSEEHKTIKNATIELDELLDMILLDAIVPTALCIEKLRNFVNLNSAHLVFEEQEVLPLIKESLSADDWSNLQRQWQHEAYKDPLFGDDIAEQYRTLASYIKKK
ncbi:hemerythrin domain-containing protein [Psychromonas antarctica]|uniref:hemerythrin domain-containing protein n=1 Tax=Psychromonas antarctica TaxID=67573 RepID=UPI001EE96A0F|nr:hemerythrin domain-containing protein [Psychromonas antarctica]MCG6201973.1 hemerythrin domain-containing protein [Psychromonas antarctica]